MRHIPPFTSEKQDNGAVAAMVRWDAPNLVCFTRGRTPPVSLRAEPGEDEETSDGEESEVSGTKRELRGMSAKSSLRIARVLSTLRWAALGPCVHVTHTYRHSWPKSKPDLYGVKDRLNKAYARNCECAVWKLEYQTRRTGARVPHFHVLAWIGTRDRSEFEGWSRHWWARESGNQHVQATHFSSGDGRAAWYFALHAAKKNQTPPFAVGRWWGFVNRDNLLRFQDLNRVGEESDRSFVWWSRLYRRCTGAKVRHIRGVSQGFSWFLPRSEETKASAWIREHVDAEQRRRFRGKDPF